jgi:hypothetical protein
MPPTLHPHLKRGLEYDGLHVNPEDLLEDLPSETYDPEQQAGKRRRIEAIASRYLVRGQTPVILSAGLRGPFNHGWTNPWRSELRIRSRLSDKSSATVDQSSDAGAKITSKGRSAARMQNGKRKNTAKEDKATDIASPEASRAANNHLDTCQQDSSLDNIEVPPATAPLPDEEPSGMTEFYSVNTEKCIQNRSPLTNPFWLRRSDSDVHVNRRRSTNGHLDVSPTRSRSRNGCSQTRAGAELKIALPKAPLRGTSPAGKPVLPEEWRSSASASMMISTPVKGYKAVQTNMQGTLPPAIAAGNENPVILCRSQNSTPTANEIGVPHTSDGQCVQSTVLAVTSSMGSQGRLSKEDVQGFAERLVDAVPDSSTSRKQHQPSRSNSPRNHLMLEGPQPELQRPASSTAFVHKIAGEAKRKGDRQKSRPRMVNFDSPPTNTKKAPALVTSASSIRSNIEENGKSVEAAAQLDTPAIGGEVQGEANNPAAEDCPRTSASTLPAHNSVMSTQAAMLLAQREFQESSYPISSPDFRRPWSQISRDTPQASLPEPSPAITPLPVFSVRLDKPISNGSVLRGAPISTQDLFGAASPFAFSTVKKKSEFVYQSSLRFSMGACNNDRTNTSNATAKSPTPSAERIPLKVKNTSTPFWSSILDKGSQASQESLVDRSRRAVSDVELPQLDFHTSLDSIGPDGELHFTDRFLQDLART